MASAKGNGSLLKDSKTEKYFLRLIINGKRKEKYFNTKSKTEAEKQAKQYLDDNQNLLNAKNKEEIIFYVSQARGIIKKSSIKIDEIWELYKNHPSRPKSRPETLAKYEFKISSFAKWLSENHSQIDNLSQITEDLAREYAKELWGSGISAKTYNDHIAALRLAFKILAKDAGIIENPWNRDNISKEQTDHQTRKEFTEAEVIQILGSFKSQNFYLLHKEEMEILFNLAAWTALRLKDCALIKWETVLTDRNLILCVPSKTRKNNRPVGIPIHPTLKDKLNTALSWKHNEYVLPKLAERYQKNPSGIVKDIGKVFRLNGIVTSKKIEKEVSPRKLKANVYGLHSFRHSFVSFCAKAGVPLPIVQSIVGHGNPAMTRHYVHIGEDTAKQAINALPLAHNNIEIRDKIVKLLGSASPDQLNQIYNLLSKTSN